MLDSRTVWSMALEHLCVEGKEYASAIFSLMLQHNYMHIDIDMILYDIYLYSAY